MAMLDNEMEETRSGTIKITDFSYEALHAFICYTAETFLDEPMAFDLLKLANKYTVNELKTVCEEFLMSKVNKDNAIMTFAFAHQHDAMHLREAALSSIFEIMDALTTREDYHLLVKKEPKLVVKIYEKHYQKYHQTEQVKTAGNGIYNCIRGSKVKKSSQVLYLQGCSYKLHMV
ncbi:hypothetical protein SUGI_1003850 [Cryptomeria japonica]|nr:BTB/POZ domain-containing protein At4g08455 isoform X2 [Cryptomeria japonica]XP_059069002.1 BTB/POZ domain-containing protein At4g08455 isoform X2 [Cryptomeria japonica]XP_059069003.1 BTB/POZ domain-containing protein At4g08455 isoform X2 [Cryptomeria japonica]XP_059069004.1 BTB/POZ domain-containing protein At4g08455 isoform X2 [Cryptomeria japonica]GLJ47534.1 hypothetical protein SUGI_1003850 [Cryptomeria japonica]